MAVVSRIAGVCRSLIRPAVHGLLWATDRLAALLGRRPAYNTLLLDIGASAVEEPPSALHALLRSQPPDLLTLTSLLRWPLKMTASGRWWSACHSSIWAGPGSRACAGHCSPSASPANRCGST